MNKLTSFHLKIIALATMIIDHIGLFFFPKTTIIYLIFRIIGRISFPLYAFLIVEGIKHSSNVLKYLLRLLIFGIIMDIVCLIATGIGIGNTFTTFSLSGLTIYFITQDKKHLKPLCLIPIAIALLSSFEIIPLHLSYGLYGYLMIIIFYLCHHFSKEYHKVYNVIDQLTLYKILICVSYTIFSCILYLFSDAVSQVMPLLTVDYKIQTYSLIALVFIICYNELPGYKSPLLKWGFYLAYPLHVVIMFIIRILIG